MPLQQCPPRTRYSAMVGAQASTIFLRCRGGLDVKIAPRVSPKPASHCLNSSRGTHTFITALLVCFSTPSCRLADCPSLHAKRLLPPNLPAKERISSSLPKCGNRKSPEQQTGTTPPKQSKPEQSKPKQSRAEQSRAEQSTAFYYRFPAFITRVPRLAPLELCLVRCGMKGGTLGTISGDS